MDRLVEIRRAQLVGIIGEIAPAGLLVRIRCRHLAINESLDQGVFLNLLDRIGIEGCRHFDPAGAGRLQQGLANDERFCRSLPGRFRPACRVMLGLGGNRLGRDGDTIDRDFRRRWLGCDDGMSGHFSAPGTGLRRTT